MIRQYHGTYVGSRPELKGKTAIVQVETHDVQDMVPRHGQVLCETLTAQFDDRNLPEALGWHGFGLDDFQLDYEYGKENPCLP